MIKELLEKHFDSSESIQKRVSTSAPISHSATSTKVEEAPRDWLTRSEAGPKRVTAFIPFKQVEPTAGSEGSLSAQRESSHSPPFSVSDISSAISDKMAASYAARQKPMHPQSQQPLPLGTNHADNRATLQQARVAGDSWGGRKVTLLEPDVVETTSTSAQQDAG